ncbi:MAG: hypothetical protein ABFS35_19570 [Bacteroidota bacterium]
MHGSPLSKWDSKDLWQKYNYKDYGIIGEPYFNIDFNKVFYLSDTGRRRDGYKVSVRDKIVSKQKEWEKQGLSFHSTQDIINATNSCKFVKLVDKIMITVHPQRWHANKLLCVKELVLQNAKNVVKKWFFVKNEPALKIRGFHDYHTRWVFKTRRVNILKEQLLIYGVIKSAGDKCTTSE